MDENTVDTGSTQCTQCGHSHPGEVAEAWGLPHHGPLCADCWSICTELIEALRLNDWATVIRLSECRGTCPR
jgi:hypothetical protein